MMPPWHSMMGCRFSWGRCSTYGDTYWGRPCCGNAAHIKSYSGVQVLKDVDFELNNGEFHGLVGENGAGKSTLIKILGGATAADSGEILIDGKPVTMTSPADAQLHGISIVHQHASLVQDLSITENLFLGQEIAKGQLGFVIGETKLVQRSLWRGWTTL